MDFTARSPRKPHCRTASRLVLGLLVCVSLLQIPLPMMHRHGEFASVGELAIHVERQHHNELADGDVFHWHLVLPRDLDGDRDEPNDNLPVDVAVNAAVGTGLSVGSGTGQFVEIEKLVFDFVCLDNLVAGLVSSNRLRTGGLVSNVRPAVHTCAVFCVIQV